MFSKLFSGILAGAKKFFTMERVFVLIVFIILMYALVMYSNGKLTVTDRMEDGSPEEEEKKLETEPVPNEKPSTSGYSVKEVANPKDLLPNDENSQWSSLNPSTTNKGDILMPDLLKAGHHIGLDTVGQSLRNANLQLRSDPVISKKDIGPWNQSTIEGDYGRTPLELGNGN
tara:strand:- start:3946 stop:4461 length:516 start_codon:yes stop_codon:yes gene_type:complete